MKTLLLVRHAKTHTDSETGEDFDRTLTDRGHKDAALMAQRMQDRKVHLDVLITSTAKRAMETSGYFFKVYKTTGAELVEKEELYHAIPKVYKTIITSLDNKWKRAAIFAHNPGITEMANELGVAHTDSMPTSGVFAVTAETDDWAHFFTAEKHFLFFDYPKMVEEGEKK